MVFYFDRLVKAFTFDVSKVTFQPHRVLNVTDPTFGGTVTLTSMFAQLSNLDRQGNTTAVAFYLSSYDYAQVMNNLKLCYTPTTCHVTAKHGLVISAWGYPSVTVNTTYAVKVISWVADTQAPYTTELSVDMNQGLLNLTFSEPINPSSFTTFGLAAQVAANVWTSGAYAKLYGVGFQVLAVSNFRRRLIVSMGIDNMNIIKAQLGLWTTLGTTYISGWRPFVNDSSGNPVSLAAFDKLYGLRATGYIPDTTPPTLQHWTFNANDGSLSLFFSETVYTKFFNYSTCVLLSGPNATIASQIRITLPDSATTAITNVVRIYFNGPQLDTIRDLQTIGIGVNTSYLVLEYGALIDTANIGNVYQGLDATFAHPMQARAVILDTTPPSIIAADLDMNKQILTVTFSKIVRLKSIQFGQMWLQSKVATDIYIEAVLLTKDLVSILSTKNSRILQLAVLPQLFTILKFSQYLGRSQANTYLAVTRTFCTDMALPPNKLIPISTAAAKSLRSYVPDYVPPFLISWYADMSYNKIHITLSEPMNTTSFNISALFLQSDATIDASTVVVGLSSSSRIIQWTGNVVSIQISTADANAIKEQPPLCVTYENCFLSFASDLGFDTSTTSPINNTFVQNAVLPTPYIRSTTSFIFDKGVCELQVHAIIMFTKIPFVAVLRCSFCILVQFHLCCRPSLSI